MNLGLGDTLNGRYTLVQALRKERGISVWRANDSAMAKDCQLFLITDEELAPKANEIASALALSHNPRFTPIQQLRMEDGVSIIVTDLESGTSLSRYLSHHTDDSEGAPALGTEAMRTIAGEAAEAVRSLREAGFNHRAISAATVRLTAQDVTLTDAPINSALSTPLRLPDEEPDAESLVVRELSALLFHMLTGHPYDISGNDDGATREFDDQVPDEFRILCTRGLGLRERGHDAPIPISTIAEFEALLGSWTPIADLPRESMEISSHTSRQSVEIVEFALNDTSTILPIPESFLPKDKPFTGINGLGGAMMATEDLSDMATGNSAWSNSQLLFAKQQEVPVTPEDFDVNLQERQSIDDAEPLHDNGDAFMSKPTLGLDVSAVRHPDAETALADATPVFAFPEDEEATVVEPIPGKRPETDGADETGTTTDREPGAKTQTTGTPAIDDDAVADAATVVIEPISGQFDSYEAPSSPVYTGPDREYDDDDNDSQDDAGSLHLRRTTGAHRAIGVICTVVILAAIALGSASALGLFDSDTATKSDDTAWPTIDTSSVPFPTTNNGNDDASDETRNDTQQDQQDNSDKTADGQGQSQKVIVKDKDADAVPTPAAPPANTEQYPTASQTFLNQPNGLDGRGWYVRLTEPHDVSRLVVHLKQSGGHAYVYAGATGGNPTGGELVGEFAFDVTGTTQVNLTKSVNTQDIVIWVPTDSTPTSASGRTGLYFEGVEVY